MHHEILKKFQTHMQLQYRTNLGFMVGSNKQASSL